ncbi:RelA/SpoT domain-containing protein [Cupriavidus taiwanensis]|uniref:RelA/SpoT domain-containing protein n=1 Tax=Cupriavidus taiwanensis TaxID=164546 RepID=UPI001C6ED28B|nr:RelA/SpoT domain-containing protein [Cupriavidus taiwanensis]
MIDQWRAAHGAALNTFQAILRNRTRGTDVVVAQRLKRKSTIFDKLQRLSGMELSRMDDVAGCRLIFPTVDELYSFRGRFHNARFAHRRRNDIDKYDYIKSPNRETGYRGIHDIYIYDVNSAAGKANSGILVEIQYRTLVQHAWATAVEVVGLVTKSQPKFRRGDFRYQRAMALASEILARAFEHRTGPFPHLGSRDVVKQFLRLDEKLRLRSTLRGIGRQQLQLFDDYTNRILVFSNKLEVHSFTRSADAVKALFELEQLQPLNDIVFVKSESEDAMRLAFKNYFTDVGDFLTWLHRGCQDLLR